MRKVGIQVERSLEKSNRMGSSDGAVHIGEALHRWRAIGFTRGLSSDADIANFLVQLHEDLFRGDQHNIKECCLRCHTPLTLHCARCFFPTVIPPAPPQSTSISLPSASPLSPAPLVKDLLPICLEAEGDSSSSSRNSINNNSSNSRSNSINDNSSNNSSNSINKSSNSSSNSINNSSNKNSNHSGSIVCEEKTCAGDASGAGDERGQNLVRRTVAVSVDESKAEGDQITKDDRTGEFIDSELVVCDLNAKPCKDLQSHNREVSHDVTAEVEKCDRNSAESKPQPSTTKPQPTTAKRQPVTSSPEIINEQTSHIDSVKVQGYHSDTVSGQDNNASTLKEQSDLNTANQQKQCLYTAKQKTNHISAQKRQGMTIEDATEESSSSEDILGIYDGDTDVESEQEESRTWDLNQGTKTASATTPGQDGSEGKQENESHQRKVLKQSAKERNLNVALSPACIHPADESLFCPLCRKTLSYDSLLIRHQCLDPQQDEDGHLVDRGHDSLLIRHQCLDPQQNEDGHLVDQESVKGQEAEGTEAVPGHRHHSVHTSTEPVTQGDGSIGREVHVEEPPMPSQLTPAEHQLIAPAVNPGKEDRVQKSAGPKAGQHRRFQCGQCGKVLSTLQVLVTHQRTHTGAKPYQCQQCWLWFRSSSNLHAHQRTHTGHAPYLCPQCGRRFREVTHLNRHLVSHSGERPYQCAQCSKAYVHATSLKEHMLTHTQPSHSWVCDQCGKAFLNPKRLGVHLKTHSTKDSSHPKTGSRMKRHVCPVCGACYRQASSLSRHRKLHQRSDLGSQHVCSECQKVFRDGCRLRRHKCRVLENGTGRLKCEVCLKAFGSVDGYNRHVMIHNGSNQNSQYQCQACLKVFSDVAEYRLHAVSHSQPNQGLPYNCGLCCRDFGNAASYREHFKCHGGLDQGTSNGSDTDPEDVQTHRCVREPAQCHTYCESVENQSQERHLESESVQNHSQDFASKHHACPQCSRTFPTPLSLRLHQKHHCQNGSSLSPSPAGKSHQTPGVMLHVSAKDRFQVLPDGCSPHTLYEDTVQELPSNGSHILSKEMSPVSPGGNSHVLLGATLLVLPNKMSQKLPGKKPHTSGKNSHTPSKKSHTYGEKLKVLPDKMSQISAGEKPHALSEKKSLPSCGRKTHVCLQCGASYLRASSLVRHQRLHMGRQPEEERSKARYQCPECDRVFGDSSHLKRHLLSHSGVKPFVCTSCGKAYADAHTLKDHMQVHIGVKSFICEVCGKAFFSARRLREHARSHSDQRPFHCPECSAAYKHLSGLMLHRRSHSGARPFSCGDCGKVFKDYTCHRRHMLSHSQQKPYVCGDCGKGYKDRKNWRHHLMKKHGADA